MVLARKVISRMLWLARPRVPMALAGPYVRRKTKRALADPAVMSAARWHMDHLLGAIGRSSEVEDASRRYVEHWTRCEELKWHPRSITRQRVEGAEHLEAAHAMGRGVLLSFVHHAHYDGAMASVARFGVPVHVLAAEYAAPGPNFIQHARVFGSGGGLLSPAIGTVGLVEHLRRGEVVAAAIDVPGRSTASFAGRHVQCSSGAVHAALGANAPIVFMTYHRDTRGSYIRLSESIDPHHFDNSTLLLAEMVRRHEGAILQWPEAAFIPAVCWRLVEDA